VLNIQEYANYCQATEGKGCDDKRFATHTKSLGADPKKGITMANFSKLYREEKFIPSHPIPAGRSLAPRAVAQLTDGLTD
jgi:hypothetical protein